LVPGKARDDAENLRRDGVERLLERILPKLRTCRNGLRDLTLVSRRNPLRDLASTRRLGICGDRLVRGEARDRIEGLGRGVERR
jgi:hypothetical protein